MSIGFARLFDFMAVATPMIPVPMILTSNQTSGESSSGRCLAPA